MALSDITITTTAEANVVYTPVAFPSSRNVIRNDAGRAMSTPRTLEHAHQIGSQTKPDRHLVKFTITEQDSTDLSHFETGGLNITFILPRTVVTAAQVEELWNKAKVYLTSTNIQAIFKGSLG
jgi:hypothetical protein